MTHPPKPELVCGVRCLVLHELGEEEGTVVSQSGGVFPGDPVRITVRFDDGTRSSWGSGLVRKAGRR